MNIFATLKTYPSKWTVKETRDFSAEELACIKSAKVTEGNFGLSVCFMFVDGSKAYIPLSPDSELNIDEEVNVRNLTLLTLTKEGEEDINRVIEK